MTGQTKTTGRRWAYVGVALGGLASIAANVAHSYVPPTGDDLPAAVAAKIADGKWQPEPGAIGGAVFWPVALFVAIEILARIDWPEGRRWTALRYGGLAPVALVAAVVSYRHMSGLLSWYLEDPVTVAIGPLAADGLMVMSASALIATGAWRTARPESVAEPAAEPAPESTPVRPLHLLAETDAAAVWAEVDRGQVVKRTADRVRSAASARTGSARKSGQGARRSVRPPAGQNDDGPAIKAVREWRAANPDMPLTRYRVEKVAKVGGRQADRVLAEITGQTPALHAVPGRGQDREEVTV